MSGHSKWATTKHKKAIIDSRRAKSFAKLIKNIEVAAKIGGADLSGNPTLSTRCRRPRRPRCPTTTSTARSSAAQASSANPSTIRRSCTRATADGVALLIECLTDNRNRAAAEVRTIMTRNGGTMADPGSVAYNFSRKGVISITKTDAVTEDDILLAVLDAGAEEVKDHGGGFEVITEPSQLVEARTALQAAGIDYDAAEVEFVPSLTVDVDAETARKVFRLIDALEDSDDVQNIYANYDVSQEVQAELDED